MSQVVIYKLDLNDYPKLDLEKPSFKLFHWKPRLMTGFRLKRFPVKYNIFWLYHFLGIFKSKNYSALALYDKNTVASALLIVPAYYKWPFMGENDAQITFVVTHKDYRRMGLSKFLVNYAMKSLKDKSVKKVWYVTESDNFASIGLCESIGFKFIGHGIKRSYFNGLIKRLFLKENKSSLAVKETR